MIRRLSFGFIVVAAFIVAACGRQVTPNPPGLGPGGAPVGYMAIFFNVAGALNFTQYQYMLVLNTTGDGKTPSTDTFQTNWDGYSYAMVARGNGVSSFAQAVQYIKNQNPHIPPAPQQVITTPQTFSYNLNANGTASEFSILAKKQIFTSPGPSPTPTSNVWTFNAFTIQQNTQGAWTFYDSMGAGGPIDPQWNSPKLNMLTCFDNTYYALKTQGIPDPSAQIVSIEFANNPAPGPSAVPCSPT